MTWKVAGQTKAVSLLRTSLGKGRLSHAYLFVGPAHVGKMTLALTLAQALNCESAEPPCGTCTQCQRIATGKHADIQVISLGSDSSTEETRQKEISIEQIRQMQHSTSLPPFEGKYRVFIIDQAELLSTEASNCLLKTLEEPADKIVFILLTTNDRQMLATVISRCQRIELLPSPINEMETALHERGTELEKAKLLARLSRGCLGWAIAASTNDKVLQERGEYLDELLDIINSGYDERFVYATQLANLFSHRREAVQERLDLWLEWWHDLLLVKAGCSEVVANIDRSDKLREMAGTYELVQIRNFVDNIRRAGRQLGLNANPRLVLDVLMLNIPEPNKQKDTILKSR